MPAIKIAVVIPKYGLVGGSERFVAEITERLSRNSQYEMHVFANRWQSRSERVIFHKVPTVTWPRFLTTISFAFFAQRLIARSDIDLIHAHDRIFSADIFTMHGIPHRLWTLEVRRKRPGLFDLVTAWVERKMVENGRCRKYFAVSDLARRKFVEQYPAAKPLAEVMHPGVNLERFWPVDRADRRLRTRKRFDLGASDTVILFVSMNFELKGLDRILQGVARLKAQTSVAAIPQTLVVGKGNERKYAKMARELGIGDHLRFAGVWREGIEDLYLAADAFVLLSDFDTFGMAVLEAMSAGLPVIVSNRVGAKDLVEDGINGFVVDREDIETISSRMLSLLDPAARLEMGRRAREEAGRHSWDSLAEKMTRSYDTYLLGANEIKR